MTMFLLSAADKKISILFFEAVPESACHHSMHTSLIMGFFDASAQLA